MAIAAIPTKYKHVQFRSRLEARWAAFFDLAGWEWHYEPVDMNGWIPDFVLIGKEGNQIFVEIKPVFWRLKNRTIDNSPFYANDLTKVRNCICNFNQELEEPNEALILGANIVHDPCNFEPHFGLLTNWQFTFNWNRDDVETGINCPRSARLYGDGRENLDFATRSSIEFWPKYRISGEYKSKAAIFFPCPAEIQEIWALAGNTVQWRRKC